MDKAIDKLLTRTEFSSNLEIKEFVSQMQSKITIYEKSLYAEDKVDTENLKKVKSWRNKLLQILKTNKELPAVENEGEKEGLETLKLLNRQVELADTNQKILDKSTLKILSLDYSSKELENTILETSKKLEKSINKEREETRRLVLMFIVFLGLCFCILGDKMYTLISHRNII